ncbi:DUF6531 domain-containing protein [Streptomyces botrytidirepellens]|uniref:RHS repeat protein n=1 Tax=Streptomyces botrytidirepellens TaxID=2486417 RepID=A0A3M8T2C9_9ACTN|nr:DUF6531 domain-containing protein [Streptomyces botrytidirepellens]RNF87767.1 RHS repeat protein [Streptomyces botrytidirepellens]
MAVTVPDWADTLLDVIGVSWPNIDEDAYRDMADSLREFADDLEDDGQLANGHVERLLSSGYGEALDALNLHWGKVKGTHIKDIASAARTIAGALDTAATAVEGMKGAALVQLGYLASEAGIALSLIPVTGGLSALLGAGAIRATQEAVRRLIKECAEEAVGYIVAALTEPAVAALENLAADLVVQVGSTAMGLQDGVDLGQAQQAGKEGFKGGVQGAKEGMHLASADGPGGGGGGKSKGLRIDHSEHDHASTQLSGLSVNFRTKTAGKLSKAKSHHSRTRGRDSIAEAIDPVADKAVGALEKALKTMDDHVTTKLPKAVKQISTDNKHNDIDIGATFHRRDRNNDGWKAPNGGKGGASHVKPNSMRDVKDDPRGKGIPLNKRHCATDPVDMASGEMVMSQTDLSLPGVLPLILCRTHISGYRYGHCFGASWASTLDERLEVIPEGVVWAREDGSLLLYPSLPRDEEEQIWPLEGDRLPLTYVGRTELGDVTYAVTDPRSGLARRFTGNAYHSSELSWLREIEDRNGNAIQISRDQDGLPTTVLHEAGYRVLVTTDAELGRVTALALHTPDGPVRFTSFGYDDRRNLDAITNSSGAPLRFTYDDARRVTSWTDRNDYTYRYVYDAAGRVVETIGPDGALSSRFSYDPANRITRFTDSTGAVTVTRFNGRGQVIAETDPLGHTVHFEWDRWDNLLSRTDQLGNTAHFTWDDNGNLTAVRFPDGRQSTASYNAHHLPEALTGPDGTTWRQTFDERGNRTAIIAPDGTSTRFTHDVTGALATVTYPTGDTERRTNDHAGVTLSVTDALGGTYAVKRDAFGRPVESVDPAGAVTQLEWTPEGWLSRRVTPDGATDSWTWDDEGNCLSYTNALGAVARFDYTRFDRLAARTGADGVRYEFTYDTELRLTEVRNPQGMSWTYTYGPSGLLMSETDFDGRTSTYAYDAMGRLTTRVTPLGQHISMTFDPLGNVLAKDADGVVTHYTYDAGDRLTQAVSPTSAVTLERDAMGRLVSETVDGRTMRYGYDTAGQIISRTTPTGAVTEFAYDAGGNRVRVSTAGHTLDFTHDVLGHELLRTFGPPDAPITLASGWDEIGRLTSQSVSTATRTLRSRTYGYRTDGFLTSRTDELTGRSTRFDLDPVGRPLSVTAENWTESYAYDAAGNQTLAEWPDRARRTESRGERTYEGTRVLTAGKVRYEYDAAGRVVLRQKTRLSRKPDTWRYEWDAEDRLISCTTSDGAIWRYTYDPLGRRTGKHRMADDGRTVLESLHFSWDGSTLAEQTDPATGLTLTWDYEGYQPLAQLERRLDPESAQAEVDSRFFAIVTDLIGAPTELVDESGEIAWRGRSTLWGATSWSRGAAAYTPLRFPGQYDDPETGLHYNYFRHYDPETARYTSPDPLGLGPSPNPVAYVTNPHTRMDPEGLIAKGCTEDGGWWGGLIPANSAKYPESMEINHIPSKAAWRDITEPGIYRAGKPHRKQRVRYGPSIRMTEADHDRLRSTDSDIQALAWQEWQRDLVNQGRITEAMKMDIDDIRHKFPGKYDKHIEDMVASLKDNKPLQDMLARRGWSIDADALLK